MSRKRIYLKKYLLIRLISAVLLLFSSPIYSEVELTDEEYDEIIDRLEKDQQIIQENQDRWNNLKKSIPKIEYKILEDSVIIQKVEIPILKTTPLVYEVKFKVELNKKKPKYVPLDILLLGMAETHGFKDFHVDAKLGLRFFSLSPLNIPIGFNAMVGYHSSGISISYSLPKPLANTSVHVFGGVSYTAKGAFGGGISLSF